MTLEAVEDLNLVLLWHDLLLDLLHHVVHLVVLVRNAWVLEDPQHIDERVLHQCLVVHFEVDAMQTLSHLHEIFCSLVLRRVLKSLPNRKERFVVLLLKVQFKEWSEHILRQDVQEVV